MTTRRALVVGGVMATGMAGCVTTPCDPPAPPSATAPDPLIDGHCHLFNVTDLSAVRFLSYVLLKHYPDVSAERLKAQLLSPENPDGVDRLMQAALDVLGAWAAPTAVEERRLLEGTLGLGRGAVGAAAPVDSAEERADMLRRAAAFLRGKTYTPSNAVGEALFKQAILAAAGKGPLGLTGLNADTPEAIARRAFTAPVDRGVKIESTTEGLYLPGLFEFIAQLKRYRHCEVDTLAGLHRQAGQEPLLLVPAMVDFGRWLRDDPGAGSTFVEQGKVWPAISRRKGGPALHGYVAYCPLRQVEFGLGRFGKGKIDTACDAEPLAVVREALTTQGFLGVKLYPPMGFRAWNNADLDRSLYPYPTKVLSDVFGRTPTPGADAAACSRELGKRLDDALSAVFDLCCELDVPIMAHGGNSVGANRLTGELADPYYWGRALLQREAAGRPTPRVMLAHFGGFNYRSADPTAPAPRADGKLDWDATWEAAFVRFVEAHPQHRLYADISYFTEALGAGADVSSDFERLKRHPLMAKRLVFGTDWVMLAKEKNVPQYGGSVRAFVLKTLGKDAVTPVMRRNFLDYCGLAAPAGGGDSPAFKRVATIYRGERPLLDRLRLACTA